MDKKGNVSGVTSKWVTAILALIVIFALASGLYSTVATMGSNLSDIRVGYNQTEAGIVYSVPFASLFANGGLVFILLAVGLLMVVISMFMASNKKK